MSLLLASTANASRRLASATLTTCFVTRVIVNSRTVNEKGGVCIESSGIPYGIASRAIVIVMIFVCLMLIVICWIRKPWRLRYLHGE
eukprot:2281462-Pleurochrysis_carterae.AAC.1